MAMTERQARATVPADVLADYDADKNQALQRWAFVMADMEDNAQIWLAKVRQRGELELVRMVDVVPGRYGAVLPNSLAFRAAHRLGFDRCVWRVGSGLRVESVGLGLGRAANLYAGPPDPRAKFMDNAAVYRSAVRLGVSKRKIKEKVFGESAT